MPFLVGLTGPSGAGKSAVCNIFRENNAFVIDCDSVARDVTIDGSDCCKELFKFFPECFDSRLHLDRHKMADIIFADQEKLKIQNEIIFRFIKSEISHRLNNCNEPFAVLDAPTLFESGLDSECKLIISVLTDKNKRIKRVSERDGISKQSVLLRFSAQRSDDFFISHSDIIIYNNGTLDELSAKALNALAVIREAANA